MATVGKRTVLYWSCFCFFFVVIFGGGITLIVLDRTLAINNDVCPACFGAGMFLLIVGFIVSCFMFCIPLFPPTTETNHKRRTAAGRRRGGTTLMRGDDGRISVPLEDDDGGESTW